MIKVDSKIHNKLFGYFTDFSNTPEYDPGLECECIICFEKLSKPMITCSLMGLDINDGRSYFYRAHKECYNSLTKEEITEIDSSLIDNL